MNGVLVAAILGGFVPQAPARPGVPAIDTVFARLRSGPPGPALGIAVVHRGRVIHADVAGFADLERSVRAGPETRFDVASIAKQFTAFTVAYLVERGRLAPADPIRKYLPALDPGGATITVEQLLHHTSGLEDTDGLVAIAGGRLHDELTLDGLFSLLARQQHLRFAPGEHHFYSNGGYVVLARLVEQLTGVPFPVFADSVIFRPLGMTRSGFPATSEQIVPGRALPYVRPFGESGYQAGTADLYPGAGGLYATMSDLARWMAHVMRPEYEVAATRRLGTRGRLRSGEELGYAWGLGWGRHRGLVTLAHSGSGPATEAQLLMFPDEEFGVVVAASGPTGVNPSTLAFRAAEHFLADRMTPPDTAQAGPRMLMITEEMANARPTESEGVEIPVARLERFTGTYRFEGEPAFVVRVRDGRLEYGYDGRAPFMPLFPLPDGRFVRVPLWDAFRFVVDSAGRAGRVVRERTAKSLRQGGPPHVTGLRLPDPPPFTAETAAPYLGWYYGEEVNAFYEVALHDGRLELRHARHGAMPLLPLGEERFGIATPPLAGVRFARQGDLVTGMEIEARSWGVRSSFRRLRTAP